MKTLTTNLSYLHRITHSFFYTVPKLQGKFRREVFLTIYDTQTHRANYGYLFLSDKSAIFLADSWDNQSFSVIELDAQDQWDSLPADNAKLKEIFNQVPDSQKAFKLEITNPIQLLRLNQRYLFITDLQPDLTYGEISLSAKTIYTTKKDSPERADNLKTVLTQITAQKTPNWDLKLPGIHAYIATANIIAVSFAFVFAIVFFSFIIIAKLRH